MIIATKQTLLQIAVDFLAAKDGLKEVTLSYWVFGDTKKLAALRSDADITLGRFNSAMGWFATNWPDGHPMPALLTAYVPPPLNPQEDAA